MLETIAAVPGFVAGMVHHMRSLRRMVHCNWIKPVMDEAENLGSPVVPVSLFFGSRLRYKVTLNPKPETLVWLLGCQGMSACIS